MGRGQGRGTPLDRIPIPGLGALVRKIPALRQPEELSRAALLFGGAFGAAYGQMRRLDRWGPPGTVAGQLLTHAATLRLGWSVFRHGPRFRERYGSQAYQEAFYSYLLLIAGAMLASFIHILTVPGKRAMPRWLAIPPGLYLLVTGVGLWRRAIHTLGLDTAALVYVYFPEEGRQVTGDAYRWLRHPLYAGVTRALLGGALLRGKVLGLVLAGLTLGWFRLWIRLEEGELVRRFGRSYEEYRDRVPAIIPDSLETERRLLQAILEEEPY